MKAPAFDKTPEFEHFRTVMRGVLSVSKTRLDELVKTRGKPKPKMKGKKSAANGRKA